MHLKPPISPDLVRFDDAQPTRSRATSGQRYVFTETDEIHTENDVIYTENDRISTENAVFFYTKVPPILTDR